MFEAALIFIIACAVPVLFSLSGTELIHLVRAVSDFFLGFIVGFLVLAAACTVGFWFYTVTSALL